MNYLTYLLYLDLTYAEFAQCKPHNFVIRASSITKLPGGLQYSSPLPHLACQPKLPNKENTTFLALFWEITHLDSPQTIEHTCVHVNIVKMLQTATENKKEPQARMLAYI